MQLQAVGPCIGTKVRRLAGKCGDRLGAEDRLVIAVKMLAGGDDPVVGERGGAPGAGSVPVPAKLTLVPCTTLVLLVGAVIAATGG